MKEIKYRQYYYGAEYSNQKIEVPDQCSLYEIEPDILYYNEDADEWTKDYILLCDTEFCDSELVGNIYMRVLDRVYLDEDVVVFDIESAPKPNDIYYVKRIQPKESDLKDIIEGNISIHHPKFISQIIHFRKFTYSGIEIGRVFLRGWDQEVNRIEIDKINYDKVISDSRNVVCDMKELFLKESERIYKLITSNG